MSLIQYAVAHPEIQYSINIRSNNRIYDFMFLCFSIYFQNTQIVIENPRSSETENETKFIIDFVFGLDENLDL